MTTTPRPRVLVNFASSLDGKINLASGIPSARFVMSRHKEDRKRMRALRAHADAVLIGASNLRADDPDLALLEPERARRREAGQPEPLRVVVTSQGEGLSTTMKIFDRDRGGHTVVVHTARMPAETRIALAPAAELVELGKDSVDVGEMLSWLREALSVRTVLCEGGGKLCAQMFAAHAVDSLYLTLVPRVLGGDRAPTMVAGPGFGPEEVPDGRLGALEQVGDEIFLRYDFIWS